MPHKNFRCLLAEGEVDDLKLKPLMIQLPNNFVGYIILFHILVHMYIRQKYTYTFQKFMQKQFIDFLSSLWTRHCGVNYLSNPGYGVCVLKICKSYSLFKKNNFQCLRQGTKCLNEKKYPSFSSMRLMALEMHTHSTSV